VEPKICLVRPRLNQFAGFVPGGLIDDGWMDDCLIDLSLLVLWPRCLISVLE
jgi:hypothetical protein